jgi:hypothetical protein
MWLYQGEEFTSDKIGDYVGFVYCLTDTENGKKYIGKKRFTRKITRPPLKGKKRKRRSVAESDWQTYYGSSPETKALVEEFGGERFKREILHLCPSLGEMSYGEIYYQIKHKVLFDDNYYNKFIGCRLHANHLKDVDPDSFEDF